MFEDFYVELFEDAAGNYFTVLYQLSGCQHHTITPVSPYIAKQFWCRSDLWEGLRACLS